MTKNVLFTKASTMALEIKHKQEKGNVMAQKSLYIYYEPCFFVNFNSFRKVTKKNNKVQTVLELST
jgi:hypothetical protein